MVAGAKGLSFLAAPSTIVLDKLYLLAVYGLFPLCLFLASIRRSCIRVLFDPFFSLPNKMRRSSPAFFEKKQLPKMCKRPKAAFVPNPVDTTYFALTKMRNGYNWPNANYPG
jgi:hypothetical protein